MGVPLTCPPTSLSVLFPTHHLQKKKKNLQVILTFSHFLSTHFSLLSPLPPSRRWWAAHSLSYRGWWGNLQTSGTVNQGDDGCSLDTSFLSAGMGRRPSSELAGGPPRSRPLDRKKKKEKKEEDEKRDDDCIVLVLEKFNSTKPI